MEGKTSDIGKPRHGIFHSFAEVLAPRFTGLRKKLELADMKQTPVNFVERVIGSTLMITVALTVIAAIFFQQFEIALYWLVPLVIILLELQAAAVIPQHLISPVKLQGQLITFKRLAELARSFH